MATTRCPEPCPEPRRRVVEGLRFSANLNTFNACADRYVLSGYGERLTTEELIKAATQVEGLTGVAALTLSRPKFTGSK